MPEGTLRQTGCAKCCACEAGCLCDTPIFFVCTQTVPRLDCGPDFEFACSSTRVGVFWDAPPPELWALINTATENLRYDFWWAPMVQGTTAETEDCELLAENPPNYTNCSLTGATLIPSATGGAAWGEDNATICPYGAAGAHPFGPKLYRTWADSGVLTDAVGSNHCSGAIPTLIMVISAVDKTTFAILREVHRCHYCFTRSGGDDVLLAMRDCKVECCGTPPAPISVSNSALGDLSLGVSGVDGPGTGGSTLGGCICPGYFSGANDCGEGFHWEISLCYNPYQERWVFAYREWSLVSDTTIYAYKEDALDGSDPTGEYDVGAGGVFCIDGSSSVFTVE